MNNLNNELLIPCRFDLMAKYIYIKFRENNIEIPFYKELYKAHINTFNNCWEHPGTKVGIIEFYDSFDKPNLGNPLTYEFIDQDEDEYDNIYIDNVLPVLNKVTVQGFFDSVNLNTGVKVQYQLVDQPANKGDTIKIYIESSKIIDLDAVKIRDEDCKIFPQADNKWLAEYKIPNSWYKELDGVVWKEV